MVFYLYDRLTRFGFHYIEQLLLPLAVLNVVITATVVALGWPWWVSGLAGLAIIVTVLLYERSKNISAQQLLPAVADDGSMKQVVMPSSVRLAKFEKIGAE